MESEVNKVCCPVCRDSIGETPLDVHLLTHSKESLIKSLLHLKQNESDIPSVESSLSSVRDQHDPSSCCLSEAEVEGEIEIETEEGLENSVDEEGDVWEDTTEGGSIESKKRNNNNSALIIKADGESVGVLEEGNVVEEPMIMSLDMEEACHSRAIKKVCGDTTEVLIVSTSRVQDVVNDTEGRNSDDNTYTILQKMAVNADDCKGVDEITIAEFAAASETPQSWSVAQIYPDDCNLSTAIKYIIEETDNGSSMKKEEQLIFLDGRYIPVYSSLSELRASSPTPCSGDHNAKEAATSSNMNETSQESDNSNLDVDLMTDEEIPPQGEISEFEESSASVMSDDSSIRPGTFDPSIKSTSSGGIFMPRQISMSLSQETGVKIPGKLSSVSAGPSQGNSMMKAEEFICFDECQNHKSPKQFASLFEMIQHKSGTLPSQLRKAHGPECSREACISSKEPTQKNLEARNSLSTATLESEGTPEPVPIISVLQRKNYFCLYCDFTSPSKILLNNHCKEEHPDRDMNPEKFECCTCGKMLPNRASLRKHLLIHKTKQFGCTVCNKSFPSKYKLMEHTRIHTGNYPYKCKQCEKAYRTSSLLSTHERKIHPASEMERIVPKKQEFMCGVCHRIMHSKRNLDNHIQLHKQKPQKCPHCTETFPRTSVLVRHIRASHDPLYTSVKTKDCSICGKYYHPNSMKSHMLIHKKEKPHKCPVCNKSFRTLGNLNNHSWSHTSAERPYKCSSCPKSYIFLKSLQNHVIVHKRKTLHFVCNECGVKFTNKCNLKRHVEEHTSEKKFKCLICGKKFFRHYYLVEHVRIHSGSRPFTCTICGKASSTKSNHVAHIKIHDARESGNLEG